MNYARRAGSGVRDQVHGVLLVSPRLMGALGAVQAYGTAVGRGVPAVAEAGHRHHVAGLGSVDETAVADPQADVAETVEEDQVARAQRPAADVASHRPLGVARVRQPDAHAGVDEPREAR